MVFTQALEQQARHAYPQMALQQTQRQFIRVAMPQRRLSQHQHHLFGVHRLQLNRFGPNRFGVRAAARGILAAPPWPVSKVFKRTQLIDYLRRDAPRQGENARCLR